MQFSFKSMRNKQLYFFLILFFSSCEQKEVIQFVPPEIFVSTAYLKADGKTLEVNCETANPSSVLKEEFGICWSEKPNPTRANNYQYSGNNSREEGPFVEEILKLKPNTRIFISGYMRVKGQDIYSKDFVYDPQLPLGWSRLDDIPRDLNTLNLPIAFLALNTNPTFRRKLLGFDQAIDYTFNDIGKFWLNQTITTSIIYDQFFGDIEYFPGSFDSFTGGGFYIENSISKKKVFLKTSKTNTYNPIENYPGANSPAVGFGAGNKGFVIELNQNPKMYAFNEDSFVWEKMKDPPLSNFTGIKATRANGNGFVILENVLERDTPQKVYRYDFVSDTWEELENFPGRDRIGGVLFSIKNKVYYGLGIQKNTEIGLKDFWEYNLITKIWSQKANYPGAGSREIAFVKKGDSVYFGLGYASLPTNIGTAKLFLAYDFWQFKP